MATMLKVLGVVLLLIAFLLTVFMEGAGYGLVTFRPSATPTNALPGRYGVTLVVTTGSPPTMISASNSTPGLTMVAKSRRSVVFHLKRVVPVAGIAAIGLICLFLGHDERHI